MGMEPSVQHIVWKRLRLPREAAVAVWICLMQNVSAEGTKVGSSAAYHWFALAVAPRHEKRAGIILRNKGYETLLPLYARRHRYGRCARSFDLPLFPGYLFCQFDPSARLPILTTPGVLRVVGAGKQPIPVAEQQIQSIRLAMHAQVPMTPCPYSIQGREGRITSGPLTGLEGIVVDVKLPVRLVLSVHLLQRSVLVEIDTECVLVI